MKWKVVIVGPKGAALKGAAFGLLYAFPTKEEAEAHAESFRFADTKVIPCDERGESFKAYGGESDLFGIRPN
jgi:hypothetical protein